MFKAALKMRLAVRMSCLGTESAFKVLVRVATAHLPYVGSALGR